VAVRATPVAVGLPLPDAAPRRSSPRVEIRATLSAAKPARPFGTSSSLSASSSSVGGVSVAALRWGSSPAGGDATATPAPTGRAAPAPATPGLSLGQLERGTALFAATPASVPPPEGATSAFRSVSGGRITIGAHSRGPASPPLPPTPAMYATLAAPLLLPAIAAEEEVVAPVAAPTVEEDAPAEGSAVAHAEVTVEVTAAAPPSPVRHAPTVVAPAPVPAAKKGGPGGVLARLTALGGSKGGTILARALRKPTAASAAATLPPVPAPALPKAATKAAAAAVHPTSPVRPAKPAPATAHEGAIDRFKARAAEERAARERVAKARAAAAAAAAPNSTTTAAVPFALHTARRAESRAATEGGGGRGEAPPAASVPGPAAETAPVPPPLVSPARLARLRQVQAARPGVPRSFSALVERPRERVGAGARAAIDAALPGPLVAPRAAAPLRARRASLQVPAARVMPSGGTTHPRSFTFATERRQGERAARAAAAATGGEAAVTSVGALSAPVGHVLGVVPPEVYAAARAAAAVAVAPVPAREAPPPAPTTVPGDVAAVRERQRKRLLALGSARVNAGAGAPPKAPTPRPFSATQL